MTYAPPLGTVRGRHAWAQLLRISRRVLLDHADGGECTMCIRPGDCGRVRGAEMLTTDPMVLAVERANAIVAAHGERMLPCCAAQGVCPELAGARAMLAEVD